MAFDYFRQKEIQIAVLETGLGGRLDATNVVTPLLSVITPISLEHTKYLGSSIESIASEKCGIIKPERPVVAADMDERAIDVIRQTARARQCRLIEVSGAVNIQSLAVGLEGQKVKVETQEGSYGTFILPLLGQHQLGNLAAAIAAIETLNGLTEMPIDESATRTGITRTNWPGRFHVLSKTPPTILDGAHNPGGAAVLADTLKHIFKEKPIGLILGMCNDKDIKSYLRPLGRLVKRMWAVPLRTDRSLPMGEVAAAGRAMGWEVRESSLKEAQKEAKAWACAADGVVCITGSLFLVGEVLEDGRRPA
jgi:dihydrofolate synthase/folylpolyglutamate synthase